MNGQIKSGVKQLCLHFTLNDHIEIHDRAFAKTKSNTNVSLNYQCQINTWKDNRLSVENASITQFIKYKNIDIIVRSLTRMASSELLTILTLAYRVYNFSVSINLLC